jgi:REP element-mobilizing transposase RayT
VSHLPGSTQSRIELRVVPQAFYRRNLPHLQRDCKPHFLTFCTYQRWTLPDWARTIVMDASLRANQWTIDLRAIVVMPDHVHMIFTPWWTSKDLKYLRLRESQRRLRELRLI